MRKEEIPRFLNRERVDQFVMKLKDSIPLEELPEFRALVYAYHFTMFRCPDNFERYLQEVTRPLTNEELEKYDSLMRDVNPSEIEPFDFNDDK